MEVQMDSSVCSSDEEINQEIVENNKPCSPNLRKKLDSTFASVKSSDKSDVLINCKHIFGKEKEMESFKMTNNLSEVAGQHIMGGTEPCDSGVNKSSFHDQPCQNISSNNIFSEKVMSSCEADPSSCCDENTNLSNTDVSDFAEDNWCHENKEEFKKSAAPSGGADSAKDILDFFKAEAVDLSTRVIAHHSIDAHRTFLNDKKSSGEDGAENSVVPSLQIDFKVSFPNPTFSSVCSSAATLDASAEGDNALMLKNVKLCSTEALSHNLFSSIHGTNCAEVGIKHDSAILEDAMSISDVSKSTTLTPYSLSENPVEDDLLAELENEFFSSTDICSSLSNSVECFPEYGTLKKKFDALQRRLEHTLNQRKELEVENARLEQKLASAVRQVDSIKLELETVISMQQVEAEDWKTKIALVEEKSKQDLIDLQSEHRLKIEHLTKLHEDCIREKDGIVVKYAQAEQKNLDVQDRLVKAETRVKEWTKEREIALIKWHAMKADIKKSTELNQTLTTEVTSLRKEVERQKEAAASADVKIKWQQNKIKAEQDANKETKVKLQEAEDNFKELQQEELLTLDQIRSLFIVLQEVDEAKVPLEILQKRDLSDFDQILPVIRKGLRLFEMKERELVAELQTLRDKVHCLEVERLSQEESLNSVRDSLHGIQQGNMNLRDRILQLEKTEAKLNVCEKKLNETLARLEELESTSRDQAIEIEQMMKREAEQLAFTSRISEKNTQLLAENSQLMSEVSVTNTQLDQKTELCDDLEKQILKLKEELHVQTNKAEEEIKRLQELLESNQSKMSEITLKLDEVEDEMKTMKRRHASNIKDLTRQLQVANRRTAEGKELATTGKIERDNTSLGSLGSQGGSCGSLDTAGLVTSGNSEPSMQCDEGRMDDQSNKEMLQKITSLEKMICRKCEKIEFLKDHVDQLIEELHRKSRIIQGYVLREETGTLVPESSDKNKALLAKKGGVMASLYASHALDGSMTMGLSLEINRKLQALLEDTLLKNIKLKEGMDTLGQEIDWLSKENKRLQQELERTSGSVS